MRPTSYDMRSRDMEPSPAMILGFNRTSFENFYLQGYKENQPLLVGKLNFQKDCYMCTMVLREAFRLTSFHTNCLYHGVTEEATPSFRACVKKIKLVYHTIRKVGYKKRKIKQL